MNWVSDMDALEGCLACFELHQSFSNQLFNSIATSHFYYGKFLCVNKNKIAPHIHLLVAHN